MVLFKRILANKGAIVVFLISILVLRCNINEPKYISVHKIVHISKYKLGEVNCCKAVLLDSLGLNYYLCYYSDKPEDTLKKIHIEDQGLFNYLMQIDTLTLKMYKTCSDTSNGYSTGYGYTITLIVDDENHNYFLGEVLHTKCKGNLSDSLNFYFNRMESKVPFWKK